MQSNRLRTLLASAMIIPICLVGMASASASGAKTISAKALTDHSCNSSEWHAVITQVNQASSAPASVKFTWSNGDTENVSLDKYTGKTAHYTTTSNLDSVVVSITANIYNGWSGQFNLSHGPCGNTSPPTTLPPTTPPGPPTTEGPCPGGAGVPVEEHNSCLTNNPPSLTQAPPATATPAMPGFTG